MQASADDDTAEASTSNVKHPRPDGGDDTKAEGDHISKKPRTGKAKLSKEEKKKQRGSNKGRRWAKTKDELDLCWRFAGDGQCEFGEKCVNFNVTLWASLTVQ